MTAEPGGGEAPIRIVAHVFGPPAEVLVHERASRRPVGPGEALVRMRASPINPSDLIPVTGAYRHRTTLPFVPGFEGVGTVKARGDGVDPPLLGRRVLPLGSAGCWQTSKATPADWCVPVSHDIDDKQAATAT